MWKTSQNEGFIELEADYARLLKNEDGLKWKSLIINSNGDIWSALKKAIPTFFNPKTVLNFICSLDSGTLVFEFPNNLNEKEINGYLQVNRENFFNENEPLFFHIKNKRNNKVTKKNEYIVSYIRQSALTKIQKFCVDCNYKLGKITSLPDTLFGAMFRQYEKIISNEVNLCIQIGYTKVYIIIFRNTEILSVRTMLSGSFRELENILFSDYSVSKNEAKLLINGTHPQPTQIILDSIRENRMDFITHLGGVFAELRVNNLLNENSKVFLSYNIIDEPLLTEMLVNRFDINVNIITGLEEDESCDNLEDYHATWLSGAYITQIPNLVPPKVISIRSVFYNPVSAVLIAILMTSIPLPIIINQKKLITKELNDLKFKHMPIESMLKQINNIKEYQAKVEALSSQISVDLENRGLSARIARQLTENLPLSTRLGDLYVDYKEGNVKITGYTVDTESALRYFDNVKSCSELSNADIVISDLESRRIKFNITASIGDGKGRK